MNALVFGVYFLLFLLAVFFLCAEAVFRLSVKFRFNLTRRECRVLVGVLAALQLVVSVALPRASTVAEWGVSTHAHNIIGSFVFNVLHDHGVGIAIGIGLLMVIGAVLTKLEEFRRGRPAPGGRHDDDVIYGR